MAKKDLVEFEGHEGVWRTVGGRHIFIRTGQSLGDAMRESGKFKNLGKKAGNTDSKDVLTVKDFKRKLKELENYREELEIGDDVIIRTDDTYAVKGKGMEEDPYTDYDPYTYGFRAKWLAERYKRQGLLKDENEIGNKSKINTMSKEEFDKMPKDYKGELKDVVKTASFRGENPEEVKKQYEKMGYDINKDKTRLRYDEKNGTVLEPVKIQNKQTIYGVQGKTDSSYIKDTVKQEANKDYEYKNSYKSYKEKFNQTWGEDGRSDKRVSANMYTNDEFIEHLEDANWHAERKQIIDAKLTNKQLEYVKNNTNVEAWGVDLDSKKTDRLIKEAKAKYPKETTTSTKYSVNSISKYNNMFNEYKKLHPNTKMDLQKFAKMMMDLR